MTINPMSLDGRVVLVTGAGQGIGAGVAELAASLGAKIVAIDVKPDGVEALAGKLGKDRAISCVGSVADPGFVQQTVADAVKRFGAVHGLVNNAGIVRAAMIDKMSAATWQQVIDVNLSGVFYCLQAVGRHMIERRQAGDKAPARIVNISSDAGRRGTVGQINYGAAKSGVMGLTMSAAREWAAHDITVNTICFGVVETPMTETIRGEKFRDRYMAQIPMGRFSTPEEVSQPVCFLLSDAASYITGQHLSVNGGYTIGV